MNEHFFRQLCEHAGTPTIALGRDFRILFSNKAACRLFSRASEQMVGQPLLSLIPEHKRDLANGLLRQTLRENNNHEFGLQLNGPQEYPIELAVMLSPIPDASGNAAAIAVHLRDITRQTETERTLAEGRKMSALGAMSGAVAHHFNNLLGGLMTTLDFARQSGDTATLRRTLDAMMDSLTRSITITRALLAFAEGDRTDDALGDVNSIVQEFVNALKPQLAEDNIALETDLHAVDAALPTRKLNTVLESLTANALEAMPTGGRLTLELAQTNDPSSFLIRISDTGHGIQNPDLEHVFEPFFTTRSLNPKTGRNHLGLGLAVVHGVVKDLGGTVTLCADAEAGTICSVRLPRFVGESSSQAQPGTPAPWTHS